MKITKFVHSCLLVETDGRTALFDPGAMSAPAFDLGRLERLDDIFITHIHPDHLDENFIKSLVEKFPEVRITSTPEVVDKLAAMDITASNQPPEGVTFFESSHEKLEPVGPTPDETGFHYLDLLTDPGDSHSFKETKAVLALPITGPWGSSIKAVSVGLELKPQYIIPIHDWHWSDEARTMMYNNYEKIFAAQGIKFFKPVTGQPIEIDL